MSLSPSAGSPAPAPDEMAPAELGARVAWLEARVRELEAEREQTAALRTSEQRLRALADAAPAMLWVTDAQNRTTFLSRRWYEYTGQAEGTGLGLAWQEQVHPDDRAGIADRVRAAAAVRQPFSLDYRLRSADGTFRWVLAEGRPRFGEHGEWRGYIGSVVDVHDRMLALEALRRTEARYRALFESIDTGFCVVQVIFDEQDRPVDYRFVEVNPAFEKQAGLRNALGRTARELLPTLEEFWFQTYGRVALTGEPIRFQNGSAAMQRWFSVFAFRVEEPEQRKVAILFADISEHRRIQEEREQLLEETEAARAVAEQASQAKSQFLAVMSHELRTPLTGVIAYSELLEGEIFGPVTPRQHEALARIKGNSWHLVSIIEEILALSRAESGKEEVRRELVDLAEITREVVPIIESEASRRGLVVRLEQADAPAPAHTDMGKVRQVLINLVGNAVKYTEQGTVTVTMDRSAPGWLDIHVRDTGPGIAPEDQERIFEPFTQVDGSHTRTTGGTGLGLAISRRLARLIGGDVLLQSTLGEGSTFTLRVPREEAGNGG